MNFLSLGGFLLVSFVGLLAADRPSAVSAEPPVLRVAVRFHLVTDLAMAKRGVEMTPWLTPEMIEKMVLPEINRIWSAARIEWTLSGVSLATTRRENRAEVIAYILKTERDSEGHGDPERIKKLESILPLKQEDPHVVNLYVVPYMGGTSQGNTSPSEKRVLVGEWTDKPSGGLRPPVKCAVVESGELQQGSFSRTIAHELGHILGLKHPPKNTPPFNRLMGGTNAGYDLTDEEKAKARKAASVLVSKLKL